MGEVYRSLDPHFGRHVAIKVLPDLAHDQQRRDRFSREAKLTARLSHPNILAVYDFGIQDATPYLVMELLTGQTLRARLRSGRLGLTDSIRVMDQVLAGVAEAHDHGIVHRDLKPENVFLTTAGGVKVLDFGLASSGAMVPGGEDTTGTIDRLTRPGVVLGTLGHMSPEQVRGESVDARSDVFAIGVMLYELLSGRRPFAGQTTSDIITAILRDEPPLLEVDSQLQRIVTRCLEKDLTRRYQAVRDVAFALADHQATGTSAMGVTMVPRTVRYQRLTYRRGTVFSARFLSEESVLYGAGWDGRACKLYTATPGVPESRALDLPPANILSVSRAGTLAIATDFRIINGLRGQGTLATVALGGGRERPLIEGVEQADWLSSDTLVYVHRRSGRGRLEVAPGNLLYESAGWLSRARVSTDGRRVAFFEHPAEGDDAGRVCVVDTNGRRLCESDVKPSMTGLAWAPNDRGVWFSALTRGVGYGLWEMDAAGQCRALVSVPGRIKLHDVLPSGRALLSLESLAVTMSALVNGKERDVSWLDGTTLNDISGDGGAVLFTEEHEGGGDGYAVYYRRFDAHGAVQLCKGTGWRLTPDGSVALVSRAGARGALAVVPTGPGWPQDLAVDGVEVIHDVCWLDPPHKLLLAGCDVDGHERLFLLPPGGASCVPVSRPGFGAPTWGLSVSSDKQWVTAMGEDGRGWIVPLPGGAPRPLELGSGEHLLGWASEDAVFVGRVAGSSVMLEKMAIDGGAREEIRALAPSDAAGVIGINKVAVARDGGAYAISYLRLLSDLYLVDGLAVP